MSYLSARKQSYTSVQAKQRQQPVPLKKRFPLPTHKPLKVLLVGPSLQQKGGMATVQNLVLGRTSAPMEIHHIATHEEGSLWHRICFFWMALLAFVSKLLTDRVSLVHLHVSERGSVFRKIILLLIAKAFRKPVVMHSHGCEFHLFHQNLPGGVRHLVNWALQQADCFVALSKSWRRYYIVHCRLQASRVLVLPNPVELPDAVPPKSDRGLIKIAFLGRVGKRKGAFDLIHAFAQLPVACRERSQLLIAGDGELERAEALIKQLGLSEQVTLMGWLSAAHCKLLLSQSHLFALPSYNEGLPMAIIEAMAWELPVISTPVGGIPELIAPGKTGYLINPGNITALSESIQYLIENRGVREAVGQSARARVLPLDIKLYFRTLSNVFHQVVEDRLCIDYAGNLLEPTSRSVDSAASYMYKS